MAEKPKSIRSLPQIDSVSVFLKKPSFGSVFRFTEQHYCRLFTAVGADIVIERTFNAERALNARVNDGFGSLKRLNVRLVEF